MGRVKTERELPRSSVLKRESQAIYELIIKPAESLIHGRRSLVVSPDGALNLIPFEVLQDKEGKYLMEDHVISYLSAGRDVVRFSGESRLAAEAIIIADPDFDMLQAGRQRSASILSSHRDINALPSADRGTSIRFERLPDTKEEADAIAAILRDKYGYRISSYQDKQALEENLLAADSPWVLHLATHGYFLKEEDVELQLDNNDEIPDILKQINVSNPMLRSGIVLAGSNISFLNGWDYGIVSAEKILGLKLNGTDIVVLSACETGAGHVKSGEGVFGLRRAFILSGAKTVVMSLWSVPSKETTELMISFYSALSKGMGKAEAMRQAKIEIMKHHQHPFYWGSFVVVGKP
jgi:CHAT domain-containing protein